MRQFFPSDEPKKPKTGCLTRLFWFAVVYFVTALICVGALAACGIAFVDTLSMAVMWPYYLTLTIIFALAAQR